MKGTLDGHACLYIGAIELQLISQQPNSNNVSRVAKVVLNNMNKPSAAERTALG
jgi:hypothetical protein